MTGAHRIYWKKIPTYLSGSANSGLVFPDPSHARREPMRLVKEESNRLFVSELKRRNGKEKISFGVF